MLVASSTVAAFCPFISVWSEFLRMLVNYFRTDNIHRGCPLVRIVFWRWTDGQCCCEMAIWSFLVLKIMECLPCRMLSQESSKSSICITWRPPRPDITDGRVSLVIFFYPDADNLERQWQTINEDDEEEKTYADVSWLMWVHKKHKWMMSWLGLVMSCMGIFLVKNEDVSWSGNSLPFFIGSIPNPSHYHPNFGFKKILWFVL